MYNIVFQKENGGEGGYVMAKASHNLSCQLGIALV